MVNQEIEDRKRNQFIDDLWRNWIFVVPFIMAYDGIMKPSEKTMRNIWILYALSCVLMIAYRYSLKN